jgi:hypothetical protein
VTTPSFAPCHPDIRIYVSPGCERDSDRFSISAGSRAVDALEEHAMRYEDLARLPNEPWRAISDSEAGLLTTNAAPSDMAHTVSIIQLPEPFQRPQHSVFEEASLPALFQSIDRVAVIDEPIDVVGLTENPVDLQTVTFNEEIERFIGLHIDNWGGTALLDRNRLPNRLCVNLGSSSRYFLFVPCTLLAMVDVLTQHFGPNWQPPHRLTSVGRIFLAQFPNYPVVRCKVFPGEAYIAPTENLVHDASSIGHGGKEDRQFTLRGNITLR